jgi:hypothetical protein
MMETSEFSISRRSVQQIRLPLIHFLVGSFLLFSNSLLVDLAFAIGLTGSFVKQFEVIIGIMAWGFVFYSLASLINRYLKYGFGSAEISFGSSDINIGTIESNMGVEIDELTKRISTLEKNQTPIELSDDERVSLLEGVREKISSSLEADALDSIKSSIENELIDERIKYLRRNLETSMRRLSKEVLDLGRRGNLNLIIGALATLAGFLIFGMMVLDSSFNPTDDNFFSSFVPRLSLVILIEVFAYFFLGLYKSSLSEIKYFQNEITNIESKYAAMEYAVQYGDKESVNKALGQLSSTERNFLLKKGESTVLLEQDRFSTDSSNSFLQKITDLIGVAKSPNK